MIRRLNMTILPILHLPRVWQSVKLLRRLQQRWPIHRQSVLLLKNGLQSKLGSISQIPMKNFGQPVSVVVTVLNEAQTIETLLQALAAQTYQATEIVIVDGGSRDQTVAVAQDWQNKLPLQIVTKSG